jgi:hypothetical protein
MYSLLLLAWNAITQPAPEGSAAMAGLVPASMPSLVGIFVLLAHLYRYRTLWLSSNADMNVPSDSSAADGLVPASMPSPLSDVVPAE